MLLLVELLMLQPMATKHFDTDGGVISFKNGFRFLKLEIFYCKFYGFLKMLKNFYVAIERPVTSPSEKGLVMFLSCCS